MTTTAPLCLACSKPVADNAFVCTPCFVPLERDLAEVTFLADELQTQITRQTNTGSQTFGSRSRETPLPYNPAASAVASQYRAILVSWALMVSEERGTTLPADTLAGIGVYLLGSLEWIRHHPAAHDALTEIREATNDARRVIDRIPERLYVGPCDPSGEHHSSEEWPEDLAGPCRTDLYAHVGAKFATCPRCTLSWHVADRREYLLDQAQDSLVTAGELSQFLVIFGEAIRRKRVYQWEERGIVVSHGVNANGDRLYRVSEVAEALTRMTTTRKKAS
ncbi:MAG: hypothetical protein ACXVXN_05030 [Mycobacteriaceae bacterium]